MVPFEGDMLMLDYSTENMYSEHMAKLVAWHRRYTRFWKQSVHVLRLALDGFCQSISMLREMLVPREKQNPSS